MDTDTDTGTDTDAGTSTGTGTSTDPDIGTGTDTDTSGLTPTLAPTAAPELTLTPERHWQLETRGSTSLARVALPSELGK